MYTELQIDKKALMKEGADPWLPVPYLVTDKRQENSDVVTLFLEPQKEEAIEPLQPGQFNMLYPFGIGEIPVSVSSIVETYPRIVHTIQAVGAVSRACYSLHPGDLLGIRGPFGVPWPVNEGKFKDVIIMAGGLGIAPLRPVIQSILNHREDYGKVNILYGTRDPEMILFHRDVIAWQSDPTLNLMITVDHTYNHWRGNVGVVTHLVGKADFDPEKTMAFVCGPEIMMRFGAYSLIDAGIMEEHIFLSMERNMKCGIGHCGHCQYGPLFVCKDGPVFPYPAIKGYLNISEL